ncbi:hypothetical protein E2F46_07415 [Luteimonas aestuarii]|uniref:Uncharacterized protein n=1 Tax=Luteimonas aestuarii TaxID=453837 RepID=A0A4R5TV86_9GAMM|nr:hypothetical protein [Luteimonas aestuarii]TDK24993.1 hypothetical protein E2F46_07415 [Luteimonas aestuarii]
MTRTARHRIPFIVLLMLGGGLSGLAQASGAREAFATCISSKASAKDDTVLARWLFLAMAEHPSMRGLVRVDSQQGLEVDERMAALFQRLMTVDCAVQLRALQQADLQQAFEVAFERLGQRAGSAIFDAPEVAAATERMVELIDMDAVEAAFRPEAR